MSISINKERCVGCKKCIDVCPGNIISKDDEGKATLIDPELCWGCTACLKECPVEAINYFLGADIGGRGAVLRVRKEEGKKIWIFTKGNRVEEITTFERESNKY
ncbi:MAG: 4Fe-4S dicluster domain-containing protein [Clostridium sp.]